MFKRIEVNLRNDQDLTVTVSTDQDGAPMAPRLTAVIGHSSPSAHNVVLLVMPPGVRGRLLRIKLISTGAARIYGIRVWTRRVNDPAAAWKWLDMPLETSDVLSAWSDLIVEETSPTWQWVDVPMEVTG